MTDSDIRLLARLLAAADTRSPDTNLVDQAFASATPYVRAYGARAAGQIGMRARSAALRALTADADSMVAADAAFALGIMRDSAASVALGVALAGPPTVAQAAAWSLGELGEKGREKLELVLRAGEPRASLGAVLQATAKLRPVPLPLVARYVLDSRPDVRRAAVYALTRNRVPGAAVVLLELGGRLASRPDEPGRGSTVEEVELRSYLGRGLARPGVDDSLVPGALASLRRLAEDAHPHVRINALRSLATYGSVAREDLVRHLRDADANARVAVAQSLGSVFTTSHEDWRGAWEADTAFTFRRAILGAALRGGVRLPAIDPAAAEPWQRRRAWRFRAAAAEAAGAGSARDIDSIAAPLLRDPDPRVRSAAYAAAVRWTDSAGATVKPYGRMALREALAADSDVFVRATILDAFRVAARAGAASLALGAWHRAARDPDNDARLAALRVIAAAWTNDSESFGALNDSLAALAPPADPLERAAARGVGPLRHWPQNGVVARPLKWYEDQVRALVVRDLSGSAPSATITTSRGSVDLTLRASDAPLTVANFVALARRGYYGGLAFHRVVPNFVAQDGDPRGDGSGGPGYAIRDELNRRWYDRGAVGMALSGPDTGGSQYFLTHSSQPHLDGHYTVFGHVTSGFDVLDALVQGDSIIRVTVR